MPKPSQDKRLRRRSLPCAAVALVAAFALLLALPLTSLGDTTLTGALGGLLNGVTQSLQSTVQHVLSPAHSGTVAKKTAPAVQTPASTPAAPPVSKPAASGTGYTPPMYGTNPHGQGTVAAVGLNPSQNVPYTYSPGGSVNQGEIAVIGRGRSEQNSDGSYDAQQTVVGLLGQNVIGEQANEGQTVNGPLNAVQTAVLDKLCQSLNGAICLTVLAADASATSTGANTHFETAGLSTPFLTAGVASSDSSISTSGSCQTSSGDSSVANVATSSGALASVSNSKESSTACSGQTPTQTASSSVIGLGGTGLGIPAPGCANGTANTAAGIPTLLPIVCNADDQTQVQAPAGVREALTVLGLQTATSALLKVTTAASESHAVAPAASSSTGSGTGTGSGKGTGNGKTPSGAKKCSDADHDCGIGPNGQREVCVNGVDPDGDGDCANEQCSDADRDCGIGPGGGREACVNGVDPDGDGDCANTTEVTETKASSSLPFTGENILEVILAGLVLTGLGLGVRLRRDLRSKKQ